MNTKRVSFDLMNLGCPVHTDPFEMDSTCKESRITGKYPDVFLPDELLRTKLAEEAKNLHSDFFLRDPSSSDDSDDYAFPETINEQVRRLSFAKRRKQHYTEFATVELARRLVCAEFASATSSVNSEDSDFRSHEVEEECIPCFSRSMESFPYLQYERPKDSSLGSDESALKEDPEPGFDPGHPCYHKLVGKLDSPIEEHEENTPGETEQPSEATSIQIKDNAPTISISDVNKDLAESLEKHTRVVDNGDQWDLQHTHAHPLFPEPAPKNTRAQGSVRSEKSGKPVGFRSV